MLGSISITNTSKLWQARSMGYEGKKQSKASTCKQRAERCETLPVVPRFQATRRFYEDMANGTYPRSICYASSDHFVTAFEHELLGIDTHFCLTARIRVALANGSGNCLGTNPELTATSFSSKSYFFNLVPEPSIHLPSAVGAQVPRDQL